jgi:hypothetical protein
MIDPILLTKALMKKTGVPTDVTKEKRTELGGEVASLETEELNHGTESSLD